MSVMTLDQTDKHFGSKRRHGQHSRVHTNEATLSGERNKDPFRARDIGKPFEDNTKLHCCVRQAEPD